MGTIDGLFDEIRRDLIVELVSQRHSNETASLGMLVCHHGIPYDSRLRADPGPYEMAVFTFLAQPLFAIAAISYLLKVFDELGHRKVM